MMYTNSNWRIKVGLILTAATLVCGPVSARKSPESKEEFVIVNGDFNPKLMQVISENVNACFDSLNETYFQLEPDRPLKVYISRTADETKRLIEDHGHLIEAQLQQEECKESGGQPRDGSFYVPSVPAIYTYIYTNDDKIITFKPLYASITEYFLSERLTDAKEWLREGLVSFLSENAEIRDGKHIPGDMCPQAGQLLRAEAREDTIPSVTKLYVATNKGYRQWETGPALARALLCWLHQNGHLADYIRNAQKKGYDLDVLAEVVGSSKGKVNSDVKKFIESDCCIAAYLADAENATSSDEKEQILQTALQQKPDYAQAQLALAKLYYLTGKTRLCRKTLMPILVRSKTAEFPAAVRLTAKTCYDDGEYEPAKENYEKAWENAQNYPYKYQLAYKIANCCHYLDEPEEAASWYQKFLDMNFRQEENEAAVKYAELYVEAFGPENDRKH